jgi:hypothetical protein
MKRKRFRVMSAYSTKSNCQKWYIVDNQKQFPPIPVTCEQLAKNLMNDLNSQALTVDS